VTKYQPIYQTEGLWILPHKYLLPKTFDGQLVHKIKKAMLKTIALKPKKQKTSVTYTPGIRVYSFFPLFFLNPQKVSSSVRSLGYFWHCPLASLLALFRNRLQI